MTTNTLYLTEPGDTNAISISDINQGDMSDCFLLASIGEIVRQSPSFISNMIHVNADGTETVRLYEDGATGGLPTWSTTSFKAISETVTNSFSPIGVNSNSTHDIVGTQKEMWPQVLEKAVAQLDGGYAAISNGGSPLQAMRELTGKTATFMAPASFTLSALQGMINAHDLIVFDTAQSGTMGGGLLANHSYMYEGCTVTGNTATLKLGNPWGFDQPSAIPMALMAKDGITEVDTGHWS